MEKIGWSPLFEMMADGISVHGADFTILNANKALCDMLGMPKDKVIGRKCYEVFHGKDSPVRGCVMARSRETARHQIIEVHEQRLDKWFSLASSPVISEGGSEKIIHITRDETDRKKAEELRDLCVIDFMEIIFTLRMFRVCWPICASCKSIRDEAGEWEQLESFIRDRIGIEFTHGLCPECAEKTREELSRLLMEKNQE